MPLDHDHFMGLALEESRKALEEGNVPVGSVIVRDGKVLGRGRNRASSDTDPTAHAEMVAIRDACRRLGTTDLSGATCYTAMEPCPMCGWALQEAKVSRVVLGARHAGMRRTDYGDYAIEKLMRMTRRTMEVVTGVRVPECEAIRRSWKGWREPPG
ncbi:MAG: nucleoside deaminase [Proteobacteria bacterium]|nr:nucleoside deaminase [Pseudomonadota bacterium]